VTFAVDSFRSSSADPRNSERRHWDRHELLPDRNSVRDLVVNALRKAAGQNELGGGSVCGQISAGRDGVELHAEQLKLMIREKNAASLVVLIPVEPARRYPLSLGA